MDEVLNNMYKKVKYWFHPVFLVIPVIIFIGYTVYLGHETKIITVEPYEELNIKTGKYETLYEEVVHMTTQAEMFLIIGFAALIITIKWAIDY